MNTLLTKIKFANGDYGYQETDELDNLLHLYNDEGDQMDGGNGYFPDLQWEVVGKSVFIRDSDDFWSIVSVGMCKMDFNELPERFSKALSQDVQLRHVYDYGAAYVILTLSNIDMSGLMKIAEIAGTDEIRISSTTKAVEVMFPLIRRHFRNAPYENIGNPTLSDFLY